MFFLHSFVIHFLGNLAMSVEGCFPNVIFVQLTGTWFLIVLEVNCYVIYFSSIVIKVIYFMQPYSRLCSW